MKGDPVIYILQMMAGKDSDFKQVRITLYGYQIILYTHILYRPGKISIDHVAIFLRKSISNGVINMKCLPHVSNNSCNAIIQSTKKRR